VRFSDRLGLKLAARPRLAPASMPRLAAALRPRARLSNGFNCGRAPTGKAAKALGRPLALIESKSWRSRARAARSARSMLKARFMLAQKFSRADRLAMAWALRPTARL